MRTKIERKIKFELKIENEDVLKSVGVYKITNKVNNDCYIGSSDRNFKERFKEHCRYYEQYKEGTKRNMHPKLWAAYDEFGIENFTVEIVEILDGKTDEEILQREEYYIHLLKPVYNICLYPTQSGKPNLGRKLTYEWKEHIAEKSSQYKHSEETLAKVTKKNKENAVKLKMINVNTNEELTFNSIVEAAKHFEITSYVIQTAYNRSKQWHEWKIEKLSTQKKKIKVFLEEEEKVFNSYSSCDKYFNMWRGYTSTLVNAKTKKLIKEKYEWEII